jgi:hypothetical protein
MDVTAASLRSLVADAAWKQLSVLRFTGPLSQESVRDLATRCKLQRLEELEVMLGNSADPFGVVGVASEIARFVGRFLVSAVTIPPTTIPPTSQSGWQEYGSALQMLAEAGWVARLRRLRFTTNAFAQAVTQLAASLRIGGREVPNVIPDAGVLAIGDAVNHRKLERLVFPRMLVSAAAQAELARKLGKRVAFE